MRRALTLGGRCLGIKTSINPIVGCAVGRMLERRRAGRGEHGGMLSHHLGCRIEQQKINGNAIHHGLRWPLVDDLQHNNHQKQAAATEGSMEGRCDKREVRGKHNTIVLGGIRVEWR